MNNAEVKMIDTALKRRLRLGSLSPAWVKALSAPRTDEETAEATVHDLSLGHLELVARMEEGIQDEILGTANAPIPRLVGFATYG